MTNPAGRVARALSILRHLQRTPLNREELMTFVASDLGEDPYDLPTDKAAERLFSEDLAFLRQALGADIPGYNRSLQTYEFQGFGDFKPFYLTETELDTLAFLAETFQPGAPKTAEVQALLHRVQDLLPQGQRERLMGRRQRLQVRLQARDPDLIHPAVEAAVDQALARRQVLRFAYRAPAQADEIPRIHTVEPWNRYFDAARGHTFLDAFWRSAEGPYGLIRQERWQTFRMDRILPDGIRVLPEKLPPTPPKRPRHRLEYLLAPEVARLGVTRHFDDMTLHAADESGWVRVVAATDDLFRACRLLLSYGPNCKVIGGYEAKREMEALARGLWELYK